MDHAQYPGGLKLPLVFPHRRFRVWSYVPTHSELVLRTEFEPDKPEKPHVELLFKPVEAIMLPAGMDGELVVDVADHDRVSAVLRNISTRVQPSKDHVFEVRGGDFTGYVVASTLFFREEPRTRYSPFSLFHGYLSSDFNR